MTKEIIIVEGMSCGHCEMKVKKAVESVEGVWEVEVNLRDKQVAIEYEERKTSLEQIKAAVSEAGYEPL